jgi:hypothetical protein
MRRPGTVLACLLAGAASAMLPWAPAAAQPARSGTPSQQRSLALDGPAISGNLSGSAPKNEDRHYDSYRLRLRQGDTVQVDMKSEAFDSYLDVTAPGAGEPLESHDDIGGGSRDARLRFTAPAAGDYLIRAQGYQGGTGAYTLAAKRRVVAPPPRVIAMAAGEDVAGKFSDQSPVDDNDRPYALYAFDGRKGERVRIDMVGSDIDPALDLTLEDSPGSPAFSASNDDGGEGLNSRIFAILPESGRYRIKARNINEASGSYALRLQVYPPAGPPRPPRALRREAPTLGRLAFDEPGTEMGLDDAGAPTFFYRLYTLPMRAGETLTVDLKAESFDPVLDAGIMSPLGFAVARSNDDSDGTNARLVLSPTESGTITLRARSLNADSMGEYTLTVTEGAPPPSADEPEEPPAPHH